MLSTMSIMSDSKRNLLFPWQYNKMASSVSPPRIARDKILDSSKMEQFSNRSSNNMYVQDFQTGLVDHETNESNSKIPKKNDGFFRVIYKKKGQTEPFSSLWDDTEGQSRSEGGRRLNFGEIDYLKDKLGFCMPSIYETLASEQWKQTERGIRGFRKIRNQRLRMVQHIILEPDTHHTQSQVFRRNTGTRKTLSKDNALLRSTSRKGFTESQKYLDFLDAQLRKAKQLDEKVKFAVTQELCHQNAIHDRFDSCSAMDSQVLVETRNFIDKQKEKELKKKMSTIEKKRVRIMTPSSIVADSDSSSCTL